MIVYALIFWVFIGVDFAWTFFWIGTIVSIFTIILYTLAEILSGNKKEITHDAILVFILQMVSPYDVLLLSFLLSGAITWLIQSI